MQDAKKDETVRKCYRFLANLHEACNTLIETVERSGAVQREIRDLEDQARPLQLTLEAPEATAAHCAHPSFPLFFLTISD